MKLVSVTPAADGIHKLKATFDNDGRTKTTKFGAKGYTDYTQSHDDAQRDRYRQRHAKDLDTHDPTKAGYLSYYILWNKVGIKPSIEDYKGRFNL